MVEINELDHNHSGQWSCLVESQNGNSTRSISIYVIHHDTKYCTPNSK